MLIEIFLRSLRVRLDGVGVGLWVPIGRANFAVLFHKLERLNQAQRFVDRAAHGQIVDRNLTHHSVRIDNEQTTERDSGLLQQHTVIGGNFLGQIGQQRVLELAKTAALSWRVAPGQVRKVRIDGHSDDFGVQRVEIFDAITEGDDLRGTDKGAEGGSGQISIFCLNTELE